MVASLEKASEHPLAAAILAAAKEKKIELLAVTDFSPSPAKASPANCNQSEVAIGNAALMADLGATSDVLNDKAATLQKEGQTVMFIASDGKFAGLIAVADPIKDTTLDAIQQLQKEGIRVLMVTGDNHTTAAAVAAKLGIDFEADVLPEKKAEV
jgi:Cu+-exporting ATPase